MQNGNQKVDLRSDDLCFTPALALRDEIRQKLISPVEVVTTFLNRIEKINPAINAYCTLVPEKALQSAKQAESAIMRGDEVGPLHGIPVSIKDVTLTAGIRTTFGSKFYEDFVPDTDALVVERLKKAGAIIMGKTNTPEFTAGASTINKVFGITRNPWNPDFSVGGSSGGAAAEIAAGLGPLAQGNDLGGSLRIPASFCGVVGLRPSPGRVPRFPNDLQWDTIFVEGPIARTVADTALMLDAISGPDYRCVTSLPAPETAFLQAVKNPDAKNLRIAWSDNLNLMPVDREVLQIARSAIDVFRDIGCEVIEATPDLGELRETALALRGLFYVASFHEQYADDPAFKRLVNPLVIGNIEQGLTYTIQDLARAERRRSKLWETMRVFFEDYDLLLTPTVPIPPFPAETLYPTEINGEPMENYIDWVMLTYAFSITSSPAISVPCGWTKGNLPVGLQMVSRYQAEATLFRAAAAYESAAPWADKRPPLR